MLKNQISLERQILKAFTRAYAEGRLDVADHLLRALEILQPASIPGTEVGKAYLTICRHRDQKRVDAV